MDQHLNSIGSRPWQFSLNGLMIAIVFFGLACASARLGLSAFPVEGPPSLSVLSFLGVPAFVCAGIGALRQRILRWIMMGLFADLAALCFSSFLVLSVYH